MQEFLRDLGPYAMAGFGYMVVLLLAVLLMMGPIFGGIGVSIALGAAGQEGGGGAELGAIPAVLIAAGSLFAVVLMLTVTAACTASLMRGIAAHQRGEVALRFGSAFASARQRLGATVGAMLAVGSLTLLGMLFCYLPGLVVAFLLWLAWPLVVLHQSPVGVALRLSLAEVRSDLGWHLRAFGFYLLINLVAQYVPVLGPIFAQAFLVRVYRELAGDDPAPHLPSLSR